MSSTVETILLYTIVAGLLSIVYGFFTGKNILNSSPGNAKMQEIASAIQIGAKAYLARQYKTIAIVGVVVLVIVSIAFSPLVGAGYLIGAALSGIAGYVGMLVSVEANVRTAEASRKGLAQGLSVAFKSGAVTGMLVAGLALLSIAVYYFLLLKLNVDEREIVNALVALGFGASLISIFARLGGGIFTKGADVGADLVGKVEAGIPEDDPRNPAVIADNVGDNVGDVAGMGADLFGSYVATVLAAMVLGNYVIKDMLDAGSELTSFSGMGPILLPLVIAGFGVVASIVGTLFVHIKRNNAKESQVQKALDTGNWVAIVLTLGVSWYFIDWMLPEILYMNFFGEGVIAVPSINVFWAACIGLAVGTLISIVTAYYTSLGKKPVLDIVQNSSTGAATNIIAGLAVGMKSTFLSVILFAAAIFASYTLAGFYGVALAASAMMATTAMQLAIDAFGPIADNAGGVAEMSELDPEVRERTDILDSVGNTTAAVGKGFAIASAALTALALFAAYVTFTGIDGINIFKADVLAMLFVGGMIPVVFSALAMQSVGKAAMEMVYEVRRQFKEIPGILEGKGKPEYAKCVDISTKAALREMLIPGLITIITPIFIGLLFGAEPLGGYMAGVCVSGVMWAIFQNNAGGAWDNAKKSFEAGVEIDGEMVYKGSEAHKAAVTGDTVGDPFKDTSGPSMNILIKLTCLIGLVLAPLLGDAHSSDANVLQVDVRMERTDEGLAKGTLTVVTSEAGKEIEKVKVFEGSEEEVKSAIQNAEKALKL